MHGIDSIVVVPASAAMPEALSTARRLAESPAVKLLFVGDVVGGIGRRTLAALLPGLREELRPDFVVGCSVGALNGAAIAGNPTVQEIERLANSYADFSVYVVEVCRTCSWNHLVLSYVTGTGDTPETSRRRTDPTSRSSSFSCRWLWLTMLVSASLVVQAGAMLCGQREPSTVQGGLRNQGAHASLRV